MQRREGVTFHFMRWERGRGWRGLVSHHMGVGIIKAIFLTSPNHGFPKQFHRPQACPPPPPLPYKNHPQSSLLAWTREHPLMFGSFITQRAPSLLLVFLHHLCLPSLPNLCGTEIQRERERVHKIVISLTSIHKICKAMRCWSAEIITKFHLVYP